MIRFVDFINERPVEEPLQELMSRRQLNAARQKSDDDFRGHFKPSRGSDTKRGADIKSNRYRVAFMDNAMKAHNNKDKEKKKSLVATSRAWKKTSEERVANMLSKVIISDL
jgi:hypothetical protein